MSRAYKKIKRRSKIYRGDKGIKVYITIIDSINI